MSAEATGHVWKHAREFPQSTKLLLLAIADVVNDAHDNQLFMHPENLRRKAQLPERTYRRSIAELLDRGWLEKLASEDGRKPGPGKPQFYRFIFAITSAKTAPVTHAGGDRSAAKTSTKPVPIAARRASSMNRRDPKGSQASAERSQSQRELVSEQNLERALRRVAGVTR
jgi:hypothetical protein